MSSQTIQLISAISAVAVVLAAFVTAFIYWLMFRVMRETVALQLSSSNLSALFEIVAAEWLDRQFTSTAAPEIEGRTVTHVREAKRIARSRIEQDLEVWGKTTLDERNWENRLAFEVSVALERLGVAAFASALSLRFLLSLGADRILEDWLYCRAWLQQYREHRADAVASHDSESIAFHRRHAEWLVLLACLWMLKHFPRYPLLDAVAAGFGGTDRILPRFLALSRFELDTMDLFTKAELKELLGIRV